VNLSGWRFWARIFFIWFLVVLNIFF
jgi:hypothetical protein